MTTERSTDPRELLSAYLDGELDAESHAQVADYVHRDPGAAKLLEELREMQDLLRAVPASPAPAGFAEDVLAAAERSALLGDGDAGSRAIHQRRWPPWTAAASVVLLIGFAGAYVITSGPAARDPDPAAAPASGGLATAAKGPYGTPARSVAEPPSTERGAAGDATSLAEATGAAGAENAALNSTRVALLDRNDKAPAPSSSLGVPVSAVVALADGDDGDDGLVLAAPSDTPASVRAPAANAASSTRKDTARRRGAALEPLGAYRDVDETAAEPVQPPAPPAGPPDVMELTLTFSNAEQISGFLSSASAVVGNDMIALAKARAQWATAGRRGHDGRDASSEAGQQSYVVAVSPEALVHLLTQYASSTAADPQASAVCLHYADRKAETLFEAQSVALKLGDTAWRRHDLESKVESTALAGGGERRYWGRYFEDIADSGRNASSLERDIAAHPRFKGSDALQGAAPAVDAEDRPSERIAAEPSSAADESRTADVSAGVEIRDLQGQLRNSLKKEHRPRARPDAAPHERTIAAVPVAVSPQDAGRPETTEPEATGGALEGDARSNLVEALQPGHDGSAPQSSFTLLLTLRNAAVLRSGGAAPAGKAIDNAPARRRRRPQDPGSPRNNRS